MCDFDYERFFCLKSDDDAELLRIGEDLQRQVMSVDDDDDDIIKATFTLTTQGFFPVGNTSTISPNSVSKNGFADGSLKDSESKDLNAAFVYSQGVYTAGRANELAESHSFSSTHSRGYAQLSSSGPQTPTLASNEDSLRAPALPSAQASTNEVSGVKTSLPVAKDVSAVPAPQHCQEECPPPYETPNNVQLKQLYGVTPTAQGVSASSNRIPCTVPSTTTTQQSFFPYAVVAQNTSMVAPNALPIGGLQARQVMMPQQGVSGTIAQPVNISQIQPVLQRSLQTAQPPPSLPQQQQKQQQPQQLQAYLVQQQPQAQYVTGGVPSGYAQVLVQTSSAEGSAGYQLMMVPTQQIITQGANSASVQLLQTQPERAQVQPHSHNLQNTQQKQHMHHHSHSYQHKQPQQMWQVPQQGHGPLQLQQVSQLQQLMTTQYANVAQAPQRYAIVSANGQQQYVMALPLAQLQQMQQAQAQQQQQQSKRQFSLPAQKNQQQNMTQPIYFANQQPQSQPQSQPQQVQLMFTNSFAPSGMPVAYGFN